MGKRHWGVYLQFTTSPSLDGSREGGGMASTTLHREVGGYRDCVLRCLSRRWHRVCRSNHLWVSAREHTCYVSLPCAVGHMSKTQGSKTSRATYRAHDNAGGPLLANDQMLRSN